MSEFEVSPELLTIYLEDARAHLEALDHCLLGLERDGLDREVISSILGPLHTLKGNSGMMGFSRIKDYVHRLEDVFAHLADEGLALSPRVFDRLFSGASALRDAVERAVVEKMEVRDLLPEKGELEALIRGAAEVPPPAPPRKPVPAAAVEAPPELASAPAPAPPPAAAAPAPPPVPAPALPAPAAPAVPSPAAEPDKQQRRAPDAQYVATRSNMVRVDFAQLDHLLNLIGELIIYRTKLHSLAHDLADQFGGRGAGRDLMEAVHQVAGVSGQLQETVMDIRMLPIRHVFDRFPRLVRDLAKAQGKEIELIVEGEGTRVDKAIIDEIGEPLVHMIRNSIDHGLETPEVRSANGKTPMGTILLSASQESNHVVITIMDDGRGIDAQTVWRKAVSRGLIKADDNLNDREVIQLIFSKGFSTAETISEISGRGVGLDVVLKSIERLNGLVEVETVPGVGTKFIIQLPLTLAIISALLVDVSGRIYAVPLGTVVESIKFSPADIHRINGRDTLRIRDRIVPLVRLAQVFGLPEQEGEGRHYAVILGRGDKRIGLVVDRLRGQQEVVIKALDPTVASATVPLAGATIMGDGRVVLILDVAAFFEGKRHALLHGRAEAMAEA